jgi:hypothetical protein
LIDIVTNVYEILKTLNVVLRDESVTKRPKFKSNMLVELVDALGEKPIYDLISVEQITLKD